MRLSWVNPDRRGTVARIALVGGAFAVILACVIWLLARPAPVPPAPVVQGPRVTVEAVTRLSVDEVNRLLGAMSYNAEMVTPDAKTPGPAVDGVPAPGPYLKVRRRGYTFFVRFFDCQDPAASTGCETIEVVSGSFTMTPAPAPADLITWNRQSWWAFAVTDSEGLPYLRSYFSTSGGVTEAYIRKFFLLWDWRVMKFVQFIQEMGDRESGGHK